MIRRTIFLLSTLFILGCGGGSNPDKNQISHLNIGITPITVVDGADSLSFNGAGEASGTGSFRATQPIEGGESSGRLFTFSFSLSPGSTLTLVAFSNINLNSGLEIDFYRPNASSSMQVTARHGGTTKDLSSSFTTMDASQVLTLSVDVHNGENPAHILAWNDTNGAADEDDFIFNSGVIPNSSPGQGTGSYWGIRLNGAMISHMTNQNARHDH